MKKKGMLLILLVAVMITAMLLTGCSKKTEEKPTAGDTSANTGEKTDEGGDKVKVDTADGKVEVESKGDEGNVDVKVTDAEGETVVKGTDKDGKVDINIAGPGGRVKIKGVRDGEDGVVNIDGPGGSVKINKDGDKNEVVIEGKDGSAKVNVNKDVKESDFNIKFYPDSTIVEGAISDVAGPGGKTIKNRTVRLNCAGELSAVKKFYVDQFDNPTVIENENEISITSGNPAAGKTTVVSIRKSDEEGKIEVNIITHDMNM